MEKVTFNHINEEEFKSLSIEKQLKISISARLYKRELSGSNGLRWVLGGSNPINSRNAYGKTARKLEFFNGLILEIMDYAEGNKEKNKNSTKFLIEQLQEIKKYNLKKTKKEIKKLMEIQKEWGDHWGGYKLAGSDIFFLQSWKNYLQENGEKNIFQKINEIIKKYNDYKKFNLYC